VNSPPATPAEVIDVAAELIGSEFERQRGWHVNLLPRSVLDELPANWRERALLANYGQLELIVPSVADLLAPKLRRGEPRDRAHAAWAKVQGLI
jgi:hypothetical protein